MCKLQFFKLTLFQFANSSDGIVQFYNPIIVLMTAKIFSELCVKEPHAKSTLVHELISSSFQHSPT